MKNMRLLLRAGLVLLAATSVLGKSKKPKKGKPKGAKAKGVKAPSGFKIDKEKAPGSGHVLRVTQEATNTVDVIAACKKQGATPLIYFYPSEEHIATKSFENLAFALQASSQRKYCAVKAPADISKSLKYELGQVEKNGASKKKKKKKAPKAPTSYGVTHFPSLYAVGGKKMNTWWNLSTLQIPADAKTPKETDAFIKAVDNAIKTSKDKGTVQTLSVKYTDVKLILALIVGLVGGGAVGFALGKKPPQSVQMADFKTIDAKTKQPKTMQLWLQEWKKTPANQKKTLDKAFPELNKLTWTNKTEDTFKASGTAKTKGFSQLWSVETGKAYGIVTPPKKASKKTKPGNEKPKNKNTNGGKPPQGRTGAQQKPPPGRRPQKPQRGGAGKRPK